MKKKKITLTMREIIKASINSKTERFFLSEKNTIDGVYIVRSNNMVHAIGSVLGAYGKLKLMDGSLRDAIFIDDYYYDLPDVVKQFVMYHELGHAKNNHGCKMMGGQFKASLNAITRLFKVNKYEMEADEFAVSMLGKENCIMALEYILDNFKASKFDIKHRIGYIKSL